MFKNKILWIKTSFRDDKNILPILINISRGYRRLKEISSLLKIDTNSLRIKLVKMLEEELISKSGDLYYITDTLFSFWINSVLKISLELPLNQQRLKNQVQDIISERISSFEEINKKNRLERILDLIKLFKDDTINMGRKKLKLPQIQKYKVIGANSENMDYIIGEGKQYLIIALKNGAINENEVVEFSNRCRYFRNRQLKKIVLSTEDAPDNSRLVAKEKKLLFWEEKEINFLMKLYNKSLFV